jgi:hypothetical protein
MATIAATTKYTVSAPIYQPERLDDNLLTSLTSHMLLRGPAGPVPGAEGAEGAADGTAGNDGYGRGDSDSSDQAGRGKAQFSRGTTGVQGGGGNRAIEECSASAPAKASVSHRMHSTSSAVAPPHGPVIAAPFQAATAMLAPASPARYAQDHLTSPAAQPPPVAVQLPGNQCTSVNERQARY